MLGNFRTYQLALQLNQQCEQVQAPRYIKDQFQRAALSVVLNVAEGSAKPSARERRRFYAIALGSLRELQAVLDVLGRKDLWPLSDQVGACLYRLVHPK